MARSGKSVLAIMAAVVIIFVIIAGAAHVAGKDVKAVQYNYEATGLKYTDGGEMYTIEGEVGVIRASLWDNEKAFAISDASYHVSETSSPDYDVKGPWNLTKYPEYNEVSRVFFEDFGDLGKKEVEEHIYESDDVKITDYIGTDDGIVYRSIRNYKNPDALSDVQLNLKSYEEIPLSLSKYFRNMSVPESFVLGIKNLC